MITNPISEAAKTRLARLAAGLLRRRVFDPALPFDVQRARLAKLLRAPKLPAGTSLRTEVVGGLATEIVEATGTGTGTGTGAGTGTSTGAGTGTSAGTGGPPAVVAHLHGGAFCVGTPLMARAWLAALTAQTGAVGVAPDYPLAPETTAPGIAQAIDAWWAALTERYADVPIVLSGDSAGGNLALALVHRLSEHRRPLPAGLVLVSPWLDLAHPRDDQALVRRDPMLHPSWLAACATAYADGKPLDDPALSPIAGPVADLPPTVVQLGADDVLVTDGKALAAAALAAGRDVELTVASGLWHDFALQVGMVPAADRAVRQVAALVRRVAAGR